MSIDRVDYLFRGSHPAFFWAARLLTSKNKKVVILSEPDGHGWDRFPSIVLSSLGIEGFKTDRDEHPIQILTTHSRLSLFSNLDLTLRDYSFCTGDFSSPEIDRGLSFYSKGSELPAVFGESSAELLQSVHQIEYFEQPKVKLKQQARKSLEEAGVIFLDSSQDLPIADQTIILDFARAKVLRTRVSYSVPLNALPIGATQRMVFVERNSPLIEILFQNHRLHLRASLPDDPNLPEQMLKAVERYFPEITAQLSHVTRDPVNMVNDSEWIENLSNVDSSRLGVWMISPAINPELGERSLYVRLSELLFKKHKKAQIFETNELFI